MNIDLSYYEVEMGYLKDGADDIDYESPFSICVSTKYHPDNECIIELCKDKLGKDYDYVHCLTRSLLKNSVNSTRTEHTE